MVPASKDIKRLETFPANGLELKRRSGQNEWKCDGCNKKGKKTKNAEDGREWRERLGSEKRRGAG